MHTPALFSDLIIILLVSVPVAFLCLRLKLPLLVGLMLTGMVIGPYGLGLVKELEGIECWPKSALCSCCLRSGSSFR